MTMGQDLQKSIVNQIMEIAAERDRAWIIVAGARMDYLLRQILERYLLANAGNNDALLAGYGPLRDFSSRSQMAYRLKIIDADAFHTSKLFRKIRNHCAHHWEEGPIRMQTPKIIDTFRKLVSPVKDSPEYKRMCEIAEEMKPQMQSIGLHEDAIEPFVNFVIITAVTLIQLERLKSNTKEIFNEPPAF